MILSIHATREQAVIVKAGIKGAVVLEYRVTRCKDGCIDDIVGKDGKATMFTVEGRG